MFSEINRAVALGSKYGLKAVSMYANPEVETPQMDESAMEGAVGIVVTLAAVIIALYITAIVDSVKVQRISRSGIGSMSKTTTGLALPATWNTKSDKCNAFSFVELSRRWTPTQPRPSASQGFSPSPSSVLVSLSSSSLPLQ